MDDTQVDASNHLYMYCMDARMHVHMHPAMYTHMNPLDAYFRYICKGYLYQTHKSVHTCMHAFTHAHAHASHTRIHT